MDEFDLATFRENLTNSVRMWLAGDDDASPDAFAAQRYGRAEAQKVALDAPTSGAAADQLRAWFTDRLTVDPGHPGPFGDLACDLINAALDLVDWVVVAAEIRADSYD